MRLWLASVALFHSLDPTSLSQTLAFYELHPEYAPVVERVGRLLQGVRAEDIALLASAWQHTSQQLTPQEMAAIERNGAALPNRVRKGYYAKSEEEVLALDPEEIDLGMALLLSQCAGREDAYEQAHRASALLDVMALEVSAHLPEGASPEQKIGEINRYLFEQLHIRFPPHSIYAEKIDLYTFLPSVMDNHLGVCLGVAALYLSLAQRLALPLEVITPPGHIYVRYREGEKIINIETTARGVDVDSEAYLGINTCGLQQRSMREVIGMVHVNQASTFLHAHRYEEAIATYEKARPYMPEDPLVKELLGYSYLLHGEREKGEALLREIADYLPPEAVVQHQIAKDYLEGRVGTQGIEVIFSRVDDTRESILNKQKQLQEILRTYPTFREGIHQLAITWMQLNRGREAIAALTAYQEVDATNPVVAYYLAVLYAKRSDYSHSWKALQQAEALTAARHFSPKALREVRRALTQLSPV